MTHEVANSIVMAIDKHQAVDEHACLSAGGLKGYRCTTKGSVFDNGDRERIGWLFLVPRQVDGQLEVEVIGARLKSVSEGKATIWEKPETWHGHGYFSPVEGELYFNYTADNNVRGRTEDRFKIQPGSTWPGSFNHTETSGRAVRGEVELFDMLESGELPSILRGLDLHLNECLPPSIIAEWGSRIAKSLDLHLTDPRQNQALIDIVAKSYRLADLDDLNRTAREMKSQFPAAVLFHTTLDRNAA